MSNHTEFVRPKNPGNVPEFFFGYIDQIMDGAWGTMITLAVFGISFLALNIGNTRKALAGASFTAWITHSLLMAIGIGTEQMFIVTTFAVLLSAIMLRGNNQSSGGRI